MIKRIFSFFVLMISTAIFSGVAFDSVNAQHYRSAYYGSSWQSAPTPSSRVSSLPSYGRPAGRRQQPQRRSPALQNQFNTLADTGLYLGLALSRGEASGTLTSDFCDPELPGNCGDNTDSPPASTGIGLVFGVAVSSSTRLEITYTQYQDLTYGSTATHSDFLGPRNLRVEGGDIESTVFMGSFFYSLEDMFGNFSGGRLVPYFGFGVGLAQNTIKEYTIYDDNGPDIETACLGGIGFEVWEFDSGWSIYDDGVHDVGQICDYIVDSETTYAGNTTQSLAWGVELGLTWKMQNQTYIDFFVRHNNLGEISNSGTVLYDPYIVDYYQTGLDLSQDGTSVFAIDSDGSGSITNSDETIAVDEYTDTTPYYDAIETTNLSITEVGVKFRIMF